jgi:hypothetical protein
MLNIFYFHILNCQIWSNHPMDDHPFSYITKLKRRHCTYSLFVLLSSCGCRQSSFILGWWASLIAWNFGELPKIEFFSMWKCSASHLAHLYRWEEENFRQTIWDKSEVLLGTPLGTHWELEEHHEEHLCRPFPPNHGKKLSPLECMFSYLIGYMQILFSKLLVNIFGLN